MRTDDLISALASHSAPVQPARSSWMLAWACLGGALVGAVMLAATLGFNPKLGADAMAEPMLWVRFVLTAATLLIGAVLLLRLARPGRSMDAWPKLLALPAAALWAAALVVLFDAAPENRLDLAFGNTWLVCPWRIAIFAMPTFVLAMVALRSMAPTQLRHAGAVAGLLAGAVGAGVYQLYCTEYAAPFLALWYALGIALPAALGALLGPRMLRW
jgi:hypothetical protein